MSFKPMLRMSKDHLRLHGYSEHVPTMKKKQPVVSDAPRRGGGGGGSGGSGGGPRGGGSGGGGSGARAAGNRGPPDGSDEKKGHVVRDRRLARIGAEHICVDFSLGTCDKADPATNSCKKFGLTLVHRCAVVIDPDVLPLKFCGKKHTRKDCKDSV